MSNERLARNLGIESITISLERGENRKQWKNPVTQEWDTVERATLSYFQLQGWLGYWKEGGLLTNLINAMCFPEFDYQFKLGSLACFNKKLNTPYKTKIYDVEWLFSNIMKANISQIQNNFQIMTSREVHSYSAYLDSIGVVTVESSSSIILDNFPGLEFWMFEQLFQTLGADKICEVAKICATDPREYTYGWPDIIMWKDGHVKFVEVKAPKDHLRKNQRRIIQNIIKPLNLEFLLANVLPSNQI